MQLSTKQVVVIGDSRHTDLLGAWLVGCRSIQVASLPHSPRWWEKLFGKYVQIPYPKGMEIWNFQSANYQISQIFHAKSSTTRTTHIHNSGA